jgi:hypothetical protein
LEHLMGSCEHVNEPSVSINVGTADPQINGPLMYRFWKQQTKSVGSESFVCNANM